MHRLQLEDAVSHGPDDLPAAHGGSQSHGPGAGQLDPEGHFRAVNLSKNHQSQGDDAHSFLGVVEAVAGGHETGGQQLQTPEGPIDPAPVHMPENPVNQPHDQKTGGIARQGGAHQGNQHLVHNAADIERVKTLGGHGRAHQPADQGMRGRGRNAVIPGDAVPGDGPHQRGQHQHMTALHHLRQHNAAAQRPGNLRAQQRPAQIEQGRHAHGETRRDNLGGHHCGYGVGTVMRAVGEVENQSHQHNERQKKRHFKHFSAPLPQWFQPGC